MSKYINQIAKEVLMIQPVYLKAYRDIKLLLCIEQLLCARHCAMHPIYSLANP